MSVFVLTAVKLRGSTLLHVIAPQVKATETARWLQWRHSMMTSSLCNTAVNKLKSYTTPRVSRYHTLRCTVKHLIQLWVLDRAG